MRALAVLLTICFVCCVGCASKIYYHHPDKTSAEIEMDYSQCMSGIDSRFDRSADIPRLLEQCMQSKGYEAMSEREAKRLGIRIPEVWPPHASKSSSTGP
jgi:hypothetical protein